MIASRRLTAAVVGVYWLMLVAGMMLYSAIRIDSPTVLAPIWFGVVSGTLLGQIFALRSTRLWAVLAVMFATVLWFGPHMPHEYGGSRMWLAFLPAVVCGYWSLGDRSSLAAFWFPAMLWMLSILDHTDASAIPDDSGIALLCGLVALFVLFLRVRESRRVALWRSVAATPLATARPTVVLEENPNHHLVRTGWTFAMIALTFAATAWVAPHLWHAETFGGDHVAVAPHCTILGLPCCPEDVATTRSRVKEYFDLGRGHDELERRPTPGIDCRVCPGPSGVVMPSFGDFGDPIGSAPIATGDLAPLDPVAPFAPSSGDLSSGTYYQPQARDVALPSAPQIAPQQVGAPDPPRVPRPVAVEPIAPTRAPIVQPIAPDLPRPRHAIASPASSAPSAPSARTAPSAYRAPASSTGPAILHWAAVLIAAVLLLQIITLALRPLRRLVTLRHLRRPYWSETVDQRVSNWWQLALVGLRDAGWRTAEAEAPREFASRVHVDGIARCATILERARHGISIDAKDLSDMSEAAETAYRSARRQMGVGARIASWLRWPLG